MKKNVEYLLHKKQNHQKIVALTCYDYPTAVLEDKAGVDVIFVGDSVGTNILGYEDETQVTIDDIVHHLKAVSRGVKNSFILADLPYNSYQTSVQALDNAKRLVRNGADCVKLEGLHPEIVKTLIQHNIHVCGHLGLQPQHHHSKAVQGKTFEQAKEIIQAALSLEQSGIFMLVLELVPEELAQVITEKLKIPTIGIGSGCHNDGQVLIINDILGITPRKLRLAKRYQDFQTLMLDTIEEYTQDVMGNTFPTEENLRHMPDEEWKALQEWLQKNSKLSPNRLD
ncbi:MAG: 3-methyl-2-oxobutanoate hydroxymethyltransferase [Cyanobacteria bacterium P01_A01_bin.84]